jgi:glycosyltransferase involved in cell wall biosynthesis
MPFLKQQGIMVTYSYIINRYDDRILYRKGNYLLKALISFKASVIRCFDVLRCRRYHAVIIYREAHFLGRALYERLIARQGVPIIFDFDDALWLNDTSAANHNLSWLKNPQKTAQISTLSTLVIVGNQYLKNYAQQFNPKVLVIPTTISAAYYQAKHRNNKNVVCIGWTGSTTTLKHFEQALPVLIRLKQKYGTAISFKVIVDVDYRIPELELISTPWRRETEIDDLNHIDIGIMPLPNDDWSRGKCAFKGIQYMALEKPTVMSPVGVNTDIVQHGVNGFLAQTDEDWFNRLSELIESEELRHKLGKAGRVTIEQSYSVESQHQPFINAILSVCNQRVNAG